MKSSSESGSNASVEMAQAILKGKAPVPSGVAMTPTNGPRAAKSNNEDHDDDYDDD